jgi:protein phosphatase
LLVALGAVAHVVVEEVDMLVYAWGQSDVGKKRGHNEDRYLLDTEMKLFAVADGMGGHRGGEVASALAVESLDGYVREHGVADPVRAIVDGVRAANTRIHDVGVADPDLHGMGTTTSSILFRDDKAYVAHVGDSRVYLVRGGKIAQLTDDHSLVWQQMKAGIITEEQARKSPFRNIISRSVGVAADVEIDALEVGVQSGDTFVLCSDGLSGVVGDVEIKEATENNFLHRVPDVLVDLANERGGPDNVTVVVAYCVDPSEIGCEELRETVG